MGTHLGGGETPKNLPFSHWATFGVPWGTQGHRNGPNGAKVTSGDPTIDVLGSTTRRSGGVGVAIGYILPEPRAHETALFGWHRQPKLENAWKKRAVLA